MVCLGVPHAEQHLPSKELMLQQIEHVSSVGFDSELLDSKEAEVIEDGTDNGSSCLIEGTREVV